MIKRLAALALLTLVSSSLLFAQTDWIRTGTGLGVEKVRLAVPDFKVAGADPQTAPLLTIFNQTLWNDLDNAGIFDLVSKSFYPLNIPGTASEIQLATWSNPPVNASMVAFGNFGVSGSNVAMQGWLYDARNTGSPMVLGKQYSDPASPENARLQAHRFADEIIFRLGGGINGIAETKLYFISSRSGHKEVWQMDYDGAGQAQLTHLNSLASLSPRVSPDNTRVIFSSFVKRGLELMMYSLELGRMIGFPSYNGTNISPAWAPDGSKIAFSSSMHGHSEIYVSDSSGANPRRLTVSTGHPDSSPVWNAKTGAQIAFVSGRTGLPQIYIMDADGTNVQRMTDTGYAVSPSWSPNGQLLAFAWRRNYGPGAPGGQDIYIMDVTTRQWVQLTHDSGVNDFPSWSPDGRHIVYESKQGGRSQIWSMLADGTKQHALTTNGENSQPNWSWK
ncbi:MAG TPA: Tol-Pal system beta propeller repeat protein TolB [Terriglobales bacterium]|nr:Tol-Pal system beta propeller repeat protein TolB [Terriglobales bacterium]